MGVSKKNLKQSPCCVRRLHVTASSRNPASQGNILNHQNQKRSIDPLIPAASPMSNQTLIEISIAASERFVCQNQSPGNKIMAPGANPAIILKIRVFMGKREIFGESVSGKRGSTCRTINI